MRSPALLPLLLVVPSLSGLHVLPSRRISRRAAPPQAKSNEYSFDKTDDVVTFGCKQRSVTLVRPEQRGSLHEFITHNAEELVLSSWRPDQVNK